MWHVLHLIVRPIEVLLGLFCVLTAIVLYPGEEEKIQSRFEDFWIRVDDYQKLALSKLGVSNFFDVAIALLFVLLAFVLLVHRLAWPLLTRTLFKMADIGTKGRRAILTTVGLALLAAGISGNVPELVQKLIEKFGG